MLALRPSGYDDIKELAQEHGLKVAETICLAPQNDPFYAGAPSQQIKAAWFRRLWDRFGYSAGVHLRRMHYRIVSEASIKKPDGSAYQNTDKDWNFLCDCGKAARYLRLVDVEAFVDRRNPDPHLFVSFWRYGSTTPSWDVEVPDWQLPEINVELAHDLALDMGRPTVDGYDYYDADQPVHVEVWCEKSTMNDVLEPLCRRYGMNLVTSLGFQSITSVVGVLRRVAEADKPTRILYISDYDPAGDGMPVAVARQLEYWLRDFAPGADVRLQPIVLTKRQVLRYNLPTIPIKESDLRKGNFEERTGMKGAVELDALESLYPGELAKIITEAVLPYRDMRLRSRLESAEDDAKNTVCAHWNDATEEEREKLARIEQQTIATLDTYRERLQQLHDELDKEFAPLREELESLRLAVEDRKSELEDKIELPERPEPDVDLDDIDESDWLFDAGRDYLDQLDVYQARKRGETY